MGVRRRCASIVCVLSTALWVQAQAAQSNVDRIAVFVGPTITGGFVDMDAGIRDTIKDLKEKIAAEKRLLVADRAETADVQLLVVARLVPGTAGAVGVTTGSAIAVAPGVATGSGVSVSVPIERRAIQSEIRVGTYAHRLVTEDDQGRTWGYLAGKVLDDLKAWVDANREALRRK
jgi:hypothetical protein